MASFIGESFKMIGRLPARWQAAEDRFIANACLEAFLVHVRLLAEFFVRRPAEKDFSALDFLWPVPKSDAAKRLGGERWEFASQNVVHLSRKRIPEDISKFEPIVDLSEWMREAGRDVFDVAEEFVSAVEKVGHPEAARLRRDLDHSRQVLEAGA